MKKRSVIGLSVFLVVLLLGGVVYAASSINLFINGKKTNVVVIKDKKGVLSAPINSIANALGADVKWDAKKNTVYVTSKKINKANADALLLFAAQKGNVADVENMLAVGANPNAKTNRKDGRVNQPAILLAAEAANDNVIKILLLYGADPNSADDLGNTALMLSSIYGTENTVNILISTGAKVNAQNSLGNTALILAAVSGKTDVAEALLMEGANPNIINNKGETAATIAEQEKYWELVDLLNSWSQ